MTDYYKELGLERASGTAELNAQLDRQEKLWRRREVTVPEKAVKMLSVIAEARNAFQSDAARSQYEAALDGGEEQSGQHAGEPSFLDVCKASAREHFENGEYEMAKSILENALPYVPPDCEDDGFFHLAALIYHQERDFKRALDGINMAIIINPAAAEHYITKGKILTELSFESNSSGIEHSPLERAVRQFQTAVEKAEASQNTAVKAEALGLLAEGMYSAPNPDYRLVEKLAMESVRLGGNDAQRVLHNLKNEIYEKAALYQRRDTDRALQEAEELFKRVSGWKDADSRAAACAERRRQLTPKPNTARSRNSEEVQQIKPTNYYALLFLALGLILAGLVSAIAEVWIASIPLLLAGAVFLIVFFVKAPRRENRNG